MRLQFLIAAILFLVTNFAQAKTVVFLNGGPGFNSEPERNMIGPYLSSIGHEAYFWNEPSELRPKTDNHFYGNAFEAATEDASLFIKKICDAKAELHLPCELTLVSHSFAVHYVVRLANKHAQSIKELILISPVMDIEEGDKNILLLAVKGLKDEGHPEVSAELAALIPSLGEAFDQNKIQAYILASQYTALFVNYWSDLNLMQKYFSFLKGEFSFDINAFLGVRGSMPIVSRELTSQISIPTKIYFGLGDPIAVSEQQIPLLKKYFASFDLHILEGTRHYPHIERLGEINY